MLAHVSQALPIENASPDIRSDRRRAIAAVGLILLALTLWLSFEIHRGTLRQTDELLTAERTREMLVTREPWVVHYNFHLSFEKPPLQYWLSCLTLPRFENRSIAVRIWPLGYGILTGAALAWLSFLIQPRRPWLMPLAVALLVGCPLFSTEASRALLDVGLTFFLVLTIVFAELARKQPAWWLGAAMACWLGSLQKVPLPFLVWILIIIARLTDRDERAHMRDQAGWLFGSIVLAIVLMCIWPLVQILKYKMDIGSLFQQEVVDWLGPEGLGNRSYFEIPIKFPYVAGASGSFLLLAPFIALLSKRLRPGPAVREIAIASLLFIALTIVTNFRGVRYLVPIVPCLCLLLALIFLRVFERGSTFRKCAIVVLALLLFAGVLQAELQIIFRAKDVADEKLIAEKLGEMQQPGAKTILIKAVPAGNDLIWDSFYLFHGNFRFPVAKYTVDEIRSDSPKPPVIGACVARDFPVVREVYPNVQVELTRAQFMCWRVSSEPSIAR